MHSIKNPLAVISGLERWRLDCFLLNNALFQQRGLCYGYLPNCLLSFLVNEVQSLKEQGLFADNFSSAVIPLGLL